MQYQANLSPSLRDNVSTRRLMLEVAVTLLPAGAIGVWRFGMPALMLIVVSVGACISFEALIQSILRKPVSVTDGSALVTGLLIAYNLPPAAPLWFPIIGGAFAMIIVKALFGGLGRNFVNPALAARALLMASWPVAMVSFSAPGTMDAVSSATPLATLSVGALSSATTAAVAPASYLDLLLGNVAGCIGEVGRLAILLAGVYLILRNIIDWRIPLAFIGGSALLSFISPWLDAGFAGTPMADPLYYVLSGGLVLGAVFMATDYVTSPSTRWGRVIFGAGCAVICFVIRAFGGYPEGVSFSILLMNVAAPLIEKATMPRIYGRSRKAVKSA